MTNPAIYGLAGSYSTPSRTRILVEEIAGRAAARYGRTTEVADLLQFGESLGAARRLSDLDDGAKRLVTRLVEAEALVVASPVYKGSYTGLFKHLLDLLDPAALVGKPVLLAATGGGDRHALVIEHQLRPLFGFFETRTLATGVYVSDRDFGEGGSFSTAVSDRIDRAVGQLAPYLERAGVEAARIDPPVRTARLASGHHAALVQV